MPRTTRSRRGFAALIASGLTAPALLLAAPSAFAETIAEPIELTALTELKTQCQEVNWVGDSTSILSIDEGSGTVTPDDAELSGKPLPKALFATGVQRINYDISGGRSAHERVNGNPNAVEALSALSAANPEADCSVYSGGTNDSANVEVGSSVGVKDRLDALREAAGKSRLFVTTAAIDPQAQVSGYTPAAPAPWNHYLATEWEPELVINHAGHLLPGYFEQDGIHYTALGTEARADLAARVLAGDPAMLFVREEQRTPEKSAEQDLKAVPDQKRSADGNDVDQSIEDSGDRFVGER